MGGAADAYLRACEEQGIVPSDHVHRQLAAHSGGVLHLDASGTGLGDPGATAAVAAARVCVAVTELDLWSSGVGPAGARVLSRLVSTSASLSRLVLKHNEIGDEGAAALFGALAKAGPSAALEHLDVQGNGIGPAGGQAACDCLARRGCPLVTLHMGNNPLGDTFACSLSSALSRGHGRLETLGLSDTGLTDRGAMVLAMGLSKNLTLTRLYISGNDLSDEAAALACQSPRANLARANTLAAMGHPGLAATLRRENEQSVDLGSGADRTAPKGSAENGGGGGVGDELEEHLASSSSRSNTRLNRLSHRDHGEHDAGGDGDGSDNGSDDRGRSNNNNNNNTRAGQAGPVVLDEDVVRSMLADELKGVFAVGARVPGPSGGDAPVPSCRSILFFAESLSTRDRFVVKVHAREADFEHEEAVRRYLGDRCVARCVATGTLRPRGPAATHTLRYSVCERAFEDMDAVLRGRHRVPCTPRSLAERLSALVSHLADRRVVHARLNPSCVMRFAEDWKLVDLRAIVFVGSQVPIAGASRLYCAPEHARIVLAERALSNSTAGSANNGSARPAAAVEADVPAMLFVLGVMIAEVYSPHMFLGVDPEDVLAHYAAGTFKLNLRKVITDDSVAGLAERLIVYDEAGRRLAWE